MLSSRRGEAPVATSHEAPHLPASLERTFTQSVPGPDFGKVTCLPGKRPLL